jgi:uncharacterized protein (TIGR00730 family)
MELKKVCVYCGSSPGKNPEYLLAARAMGKELAKREITLVYGGGRAGLMGEVARATLANGGQVIGVIPKALRDQELAFHELADLHVVDSMHERKALMAELSDAFVALPGGYGTLEEIFEVLTWVQLGFHTKPCGVLNINHYYDHLLEFLDHSVAEQFIYQPHRDLVLQALEPAELIDRFSAYQPVKMNKAAWVHNMEHQSGNAE